MGTALKGKDRFGRKNGNDELYDLAADPYETENLAGTVVGRRKVAEMTALLADWMKETADPALRRFTFTKSGTLGLDVNPAA